MIHREREREAVCAGDQDVYTVRLYIKGDRDAIALFRGLYSLGVVLAQGDGQLLGVVSVFMKSFAGKCDGNAMVRCKIGWD